MATGPAARLSAVARHLAMAVPESPDQDGLLEYSVVYSDRSINHMSAQFQRVMCDISATLKEVYNASAVAVIPGSGSYGMEAVARQFATGKKAMVLRNGYFSFRWTDIFERGAIPSEHIVMKSRPEDGTPTAQFSPCPIDEVCAAIARERPAVVFAPHVETSAGLIISDEYIKAVSDAVHAVGGLFVLDCIASGCIWVDMKAVGADALISAPQKGWSGPPCAGLVMLSDRGAAAVDASKSTSLALDLGTWLKVMRTYENGGHMYFTTMPTDALKTFRDIMRECRLIGFQQLKDAQRVLGARMRAAMEARGIKSVAAPGFQAPTVVVSHTTDPAVQSGKRFLDAGVQIASGVPLKVGEHQDYRSFRIGLFGLDKLTNIDRTVRLFTEVLDKCPALT